MVAKSALDAATGKYNCLNTGSLGPNHEPHLSYQDITMEHTTPVVDHWNKSGGNDMTQADRNDWYDDPSHLVVFCGSCNSSRDESDRSSTYTPKVGPDFRGAKDE